MQSGLFLWPKYPSKLLLFDFLMGNSAKIFLCWTTGFQMRNQTFSSSLCYVGKLGYIWNPIFWGTPDYQRLFLKMFALLSLSLPVPVFYNRQLWFLLLKFFWFGSHLYGTQAANGRLLLVAASDFVTIFYLEYYESHFLMLKVFSKDSIILVPVLLYSLCGFCCLLLLNRVTRSKGVRGVPQMLQIMH